MQLANLVSSTTGAAPVKWIEPVPTRFYCPRSLYEAWASEPGGFPGTWLGDTFQSPGGSYTFYVDSGPCCRLYYDNGQPEPHSFAQGWKPKDEVAFNNNPVGYGRLNKNWVRTSANYLSYLTRLVNGREVTYQTVRWESPVSPEVELAKICTLVCPLKEPVPASYSSAA